MQHVLNSAQHEVNAIQVLAVLRMLIITYFQNNLV